MGSCRFHVQIASIRARETALPILLVHVGLCVYKHCLKKKVIKCLGEDDTICTP